MVENAGATAGIILMDAPRIRRAIDRMACEILEDVPATDTLAILGIDDRGYNLARYLADALEKHSDIPVKCIRLKVRSGTDTADETSELSEKQSNLILVDDVLFSGTIMMKAMRRIMDHAVPGDLQVAVLIDRGHRRFPIAARYTGLVSPTKLDEHVAVVFDQQNQPESVILTKSHRSQG
ncbi:MAG: phosphoribosyltransferase family protein [Cyclonatronaceae bacterium]